MLIAGKSYQQKQVLYVSINLKNKYTYAYAASSTAVYRLDRVGPFSQRESLLLKKVGHAHIW